MPNYQNGKIYKLWSPSTGLTYYGSTTQKLAQRLAEHKANQGKYESKIVMKQPDYCIELLENYPCSNKYQLERKEGEWIKNNECVNKIVAGRTKLEYRTDHRGDILLTQKKYNDLTKEKRSQYYKEYYIIHKEEIDQRNKANKLKKKLELANNL